MSRTPLYQSLDPAGRLRSQVAGVRADRGAEAGGKTTWLVHADSLAGLAPKAGDRCRGADGKWWRVESVGEAADGTYPCVCTPLEG